MDNPTVTFPEAGSVALRDAAMPAVGSNEVKIRTDRSLVSIGTELTVLSGEFPEGSYWDDYGEYPFEAGYCNVGTVVETGDAVEDSWLGRHVATRTPHSKYSTLDPKADLYAPVPDGVDPEDAAFFALGAIAMNGLRQSRLDWGEDVAIFGLGLVGQLAARFCRIAGARSVTAFDLAERRRGYLDEDAVIEGFDPTETNPEEVVGRAASSEFADVVFEVTGVPEAIPDQFDVLGPRGRFVVLSSPRGRTELDLHDLCNAPSYEIIGAHESSHTPQKQEGWSYGPVKWNHRQHYDLFFKYLKSGRIDVSSLVSHRVSIEEAEETYESLLNDRTDALGVVLEW